MKIGIFAGTFDPIHNGHLSFARAAIDQAGLDEVWLIPEPQPRGKAVVTDYRHRLNMLRLAANTPFQVVELSEPTFTLPQSWPELRRRAGAAELFLLLGADAAARASTWPDWDRFASDFTLLVGQRELDGDQPTPDRRTVTIAHTEPSTSSSQVRSGDLTVLPPRVAQYVREHQLYASSLANS